MTISKMYGTAVKFNLTPPCWFFKGGIFLSPPATVSYYDIKCTKKQEQNYIFSNFLSIITLRNKWKIVAE